jgi:hypothetical protein
MIWPSGAFSALEIARVCAIDRIAYGSRLRHLDSAREHSASAAPTTRPSSVRASAVATIPSPVSFGRVPVTTATTPTMPPNVVHPSTVICRLPLMIA